ncbi:SAM-dependent methyltransferase [Candidatus Bathyarchaeota archaeon]|jgi:tRNA (adenine37-N6)-methyltransferase|nr:SAM-dependent methyltransferase [Candidatus Bathyarchaeota archaeon]MBT6605276.1 SAM-dependent methyltransferase [Candidatus Bathyarchaeota archaeon]MBT7187632.1 SAM-dependent methyltransferase [Candidatus Bathyarchaeota archaeon]
MECVIIGEVKSNVTEAVDMDWGEVVSEIVLKPRYAPGLLGLDDFSHALILTFLHEAKYDPEVHLRRHPQENMNNPLRGIFAQRARHRPNRIGVTACEIVEVTENSVKVIALDAINGTPVLDVKPYVPLYDRKDATVPEWIDKMMRDYF